jgi:D-psicose/D-tagatose/L-ribulose 3-epimerase
VAPLGIQAGFDYFEWSVGGLLKPREDEAAFNQAMAEAQRSGLPCPVANVFIPADLKVTGPAADLAALEAYVSTACRRANQAGVQVIVFGSGGARRIPDGYGRSQAWDQLVAFGRMLGPIAASQALTIAIEPLNLAECNVLNAVGECARLVRQVNHPAIRLLVDAYHQMRDGDSLDDMLSNRDILAHIHVATIPNRLAPGMEASPLEAFFKVLGRSGYDRRVSIEGNLPGQAAELVQSLKLMKTWLEK